jgi:hypothetical protein
MAHQNIDQRRETVGKVLSAGIQIKGREAKVLGVIFNCSVSAITADVKSFKAPREAAPIRPSGRAS